MRVRRLGIAPALRSEAVRGRAVGALACVLALAASEASAAAAETKRKPEGAPAAQPAPAAPAGPQKFDIDEFEVQGADALPQIELEEAIYPYLGPGRTPDDVEKARAALEKAYQAKGLQTVSVSVPPQNVERRVIVLKVAEVKVGRLRVKGSRYFDQEKIAGKAPSLREGELPNFNDVAKDVTALNQWPDRRVTPALRAGVKPGTVDVDLNVEDTLPFHGSVELNNRQTPNTAALRLTGTARYDNLWQLGHSLTLSATVAPERPKDSRSFSASYLARLPDNDQLSFLFSALKSDSDINLDGVSANGAATVVGPTAQLGARAVMTLPARENFFHTVSIGADYKESGSDFRIRFPNDKDGKPTPDFLSRTPLSYSVAAAAYNATLQDADGSLTQLALDATLGLRGLGDSVAAFDLKRTNSRADFLTLKSDLSRTQELPKGFQLFGRVQSQLASGALVSSEQFGLGGLDSVRGYLESEVVGDNGVSGTIELRSPNLASYLPVSAPDKDGAQEPKLKPLNELRFFGFVDAGYAKLRQSLPEERASFGDWSLGGGATFKSFDYLNGSVVLAVPMLDETDTEAGDPRFLFRFWGEF